ncbi:MAG: PAS domain-containing sensor histidine kinase [Clostridium sp.]|uniref:sensor histidine kinase n=1 Tax=Clostridium sp. TaxID=1506 RepID=UPI0025C4443B|nr:PAS domain-containing sensor histidine kinase [Clostridium sp.]MBS4958363.1 PAS domain-containing sensor histidine kinase [Clostridium sp.]
MEVGEIFDKKSELEYFFEISVDIMAIIGEDGKIKKISKGCSELLGWNEKELFEHEWHNFIHKEDLKSILSTIKSESISSGVKGLRVRFKCKNDDYKLVEYSCKFIEEKQVYILTARDITEEKKIAYEKAIELESLKSEFFSNISHEFKTPLNIILATMQVINKNIENKNIQATDEEILNKYMNSIRQNCYRLLRLVNNIIDISKMDYGYYNIELGNYNIISVVEDITMSILEYVNNKGIELIFDTESEEEIIACDPDKIERIILNLLSNAIKYTKEGGKIYVNIGKDNKNVYISVTDNGIGMPEKKLLTIFERYTQIDNNLTRRANGSGIGLSLVKSLVKMHQGDIYVESKINEGSKFIISLPIRQVESKNKKISNLTKSKVEKCSIEFADIYN